MISAGVKGVEYFACNTDLQALRKCAAPNKLQIGGRLTKGLGAGADPDVGRNAALEDQDRLAQAVAGADMVFLAMGLGGGTGSGAGPIIAKLAAEAGALAVAVVTKPFEFEGKKRMRQAERASRELRDHVDTLITIPNQRLLAFVERNTPLQESFKIADDVLRQAIQGISDLINCPGEINLDFADVRKIMSDMGRALMGTAVADGENRAIHAAQAAISSPLLEDASIEGARGVLINITGGHDLTLFEVDGGRADHPAGGRSRGRDPLRLRPRREDGRHRQGHGHRDRIRPPRARPRGHRSGRAAEAAAPSDPSPCVRRFCAATTPAASARTLRRGTISTFRRSCAGKWTEEEAGVRRQEAGVQGFVDTCPGP